MGRRGPPEARAKGPRRRRRRHTAPGKPTTPARSARPPAPPPPEANRSAPRDSPGAVQRATRDLAADRARARREHARGGSEPLRERALGAAERRARLDSAHQGPESVGSLDVVQGERQRAPQRSRGHRAHEHEIADQRIARAPAHERIANLPDLDRTVDAPAAPNDVAIGHDILDLRAPPERNAPGTERERRAPRRKHDHSAYWYLERLGDDGVAKRHPRDHPRPDRRRLLSERNRRSATPPLPHDALAK